MSKIIRNDQETYSSWTVPDVQGSHVVGSGNENNVSISTNLRSKLQQQKNKKEFDRGYQDGMQAAAKKILEQEQVLKNKMKYLDELVMSLNEPFEKLDQEVEKELVTLAIAIAKQIIRREIKIDPGQIMAVIRQALECLPVSSRNIKIALHPEDSALVQELSTISEENEQWQLVEDPTLMRGGCRLTTATSRIDASVESRLAAIFSQILGGEREQDKSDS